jgi:hypothetical protein
MVTGRVLGLQRLADGLLYETEVLLAGAGGVEAAVICLANSACVASASFGSGTRWPKTSANGFTAPAPVRASPLVEVRQPAGEIGP